MIPIRARPADHRLVQVRGANAVIAFSICVFHPADDGARRGLTDLLDLVRTLRGSRGRSSPRSVAGALPYIFSGMKVAAILAVAGAIVGDSSAPTRARLPDAGAGDARHRGDTMAVLLITFISMLLTPCSPSSAPSSFPMRSVMSQPAR
jgi:NitT/TauT family transport system permease protein